MPEDVVKWWYTKSADVGIRVISTDTGRDRCGHLASGEEDAMLVSVRMVALGSAGVLRFRVCKIEYSLEGIGIMALKLKKVCPAYRQCEKTSSPFLFQGAHVI
jgi:hypothetical protein